MEKNNTGYKVIVTILIIAVVGLVSYIVYDKMSTDKIVNNDNTTQENNDTSSNSTLEEMHKEYQNVKWDNEEIYGYKIEDNVLKKCVKYENGKCNEYADVNMSETPIKLGIYSDCGGSYSFVLSKEGKVYQISDDNKLTKILKEYNIIDIGHLYVQASCSQEIPYFLTSDGKLIDLAGTLYEEIHPNYIKGELDELRGDIFYSSDNHIYKKEFTPFDNQDYCNEKGPCYIAGKYNYIILKNNKNDEIVVKSIYMNYSNNEYLVIDKDNKLYIVNDKFNVIDSEYNEKIIDKVVKNCLNNSSDAKIIIQLSDGTEYQSIYSNGKENYDFKNYISGC